jgi:hypothetical protein
LSEIKVTKTEKEEPKIDDKKNDDITDKKGIDEIEEEPKKEK